MAPKGGRIRECDLTDPVLRVLAGTPGGELSTSEIIARMRSLLPLSSKDLEILDGRQDERFTQIVRNIKSHKNQPGNAIYEGLICEVPKGLKITAKGRNHIEVSKLI